MNVQHMTCGLVELKFDGGGDAVTGMRFEGYGAVFGNIDAHGDVIDPGAFAKFLSEVKAGTQAWPAMLSQHGAWQVTAEDMTPIGVWTELAEDGHGLKTTGELADTPRGREMYTLMKMSPRPAIDGLSIGYIAKESEPRSKPEDPKRRLKRIDLIEISPVTRPANGKARVSSVKSAEDMSIREFEQLLTQDAGFSRSQARIIINQGFKALSSMTDSGDHDPQQLQEIIASAVRMQSIKR